MSGILRKIADVVTPLGIYDAAAKKGIYAKGEPIPNAIKAAKESPPAEFFEDAFTHSHSKARKVLDVVAPPVLVADAINGKGIFSR